VTLDGTTIISTPYSALTLNGVGGNDTFDVRGTNAGSTTIVNAVSGANLFNIGSAANTLDPIQGAVLVNGRGSDILNTYDQGATTNEEYDVFANQVLRTPFTLPSSNPTQTIAYSNLSNLNLYGATASDLLDIEGTPQGTSVSVTGGVRGPSNNHNEFIVENFNSLDDIQGPVAIHGTSIYDFLSVVDSGNTASHTYTLSARSSSNSVQRDGMANISYDGIGEFVLAAVDNPGLFTPDVVNVQSTPANVFTVVAVSTGDTVNLGQPTGIGTERTLQHFLGEIRVQSLATDTPTVVVDDSGDPTSHPQVVYQNSSIGLVLTGLAGPASIPQRIDFQIGNTANVSLLGGSGINGLTFSAPGDFAQNWTFSGFAASSFSVPGNFSGQLLAPTLGTAAAPVQQVQIGGAMTAGAKITVDYLDSLSAGGDLAGTVKGFGNSGSQSQPTVGTVTVGGNVTSTGSITAPILGTISITGSDAGTISESNPTQDIQQLTIGGSLTSSGIVSAASIGAMSVGQDLAGQVHAAGPLNTMTVGGNLTGTVSAATIGTVTVGGTLTGQVTAAQSLGSVTAAGKPVAQSIFLLDPSVSAALNVSGNAHITIPGSIFVDSASPTAVMVGGSAQVTAAGIQVVGGVQQSGSVTLSPAPATGAAAFSDPMAFLSGPSTSGMTNYGSVSYGNGSHMLQPGIYSQIKASGNASLTLSPGLYIIEGGGLTVTGNASISGTGVTIYNTGSNYPNAGGNFGGITLSGNRSFTLTPANGAAGGAYPGIVIYQSRSNTRALALSGNASAGPTGMVYAPSAPVVIGGNATFNAALVADRLQVSGNGSSTQVAAGSTGDNSASPATLLAGDLEVYVNDPSGYFTPNELARIQDAISNWDALLAPYNVQITEVSDPVAGQCGDRRWCHERCRQCRRRHPGLLQRGEQRDHHPAGLELVQRRRSDPDRHQRVRFPDGGDTRAGPRPGPGRQCQSEFADVRDPGHRCGPADADGCRSQYL
jgi:hypothetical protein